MIKINLKWTIDELQKKQFENIEFPEFQREASVWDLDKKRKLIDSILRDFDIAGIYLYKREDGNYECIDGRQRINAILSFLGLNVSKDEENANRANNNFRFISSDELLGNQILTEYNNKTWQELKPSQQAKILNYVMNVIEITGIDNDEELNLMFLRLQLGVPLNAGEKLNAMLGDMRNFIFKNTLKDKGLGSQQYFRFLEIPQRRFSKELTASQIALNFFSLQTNEGFKRARFIDLQEFYRRYQKFETKDKSTRDLLIKRLKLVYDYLKDERKLKLKNRAIGVSVFFFINMLIEKGQTNQINDFIKFLTLFLKRLKEQIEKGIDIEPRYRDLLKFQTYITQAAVEKYAIENRQEFLWDYFNYYQKNNKKIKGDK